VDPLTPGIDTPVHAAARAASPTFFAEHRDAQGFVDHGARTLLPEVVAERGLDADRVQVLPHGGSGGL
jgi:hypothetical protein